MQSKNLPEFSNNLFRLISLKKINSKINKKKIDPF